jgi:recombination protein RecT
MASATATKGRQNTGNHPQPKQEGTGNVVPSRGQTPEQKEQGSKAGQNFLDEIFSEQHAGQITSALSNSLPYESFKASVSAAIMANPKLLACKPGLLFREIITIARLGLSFDKTLGEAYLFPAWNNVSRQLDAVQARVGYQGLMKLARNEDNLRIYAHEVHESDECIVELGVDKKLVHKPKVFGVRGPVVGFYAVVKYPNGESDFEPMSQAEVDAIRDRTESWKAYKAGKITSAGPWQTDPVEMGKKTVIRRLCKRLPKGPKMTAALDIEDSAEGVVPQSPPQLPSSSGAKAGGNGSLDRFAGRGNGNVTDINPDDPASNGEQQEQQQEQEQPEQAEQQPAEGKSSAAAHAEVRETLKKSGGEMIFTDREAAEMDESADQKPEQGDLLSTAPKQTAQTREQAIAENPLLALVPKMPEEIDRLWNTSGDFKASWKWINEEMINITDAEVRQATVEEYKMLLWTVEARSPAYKEAVRKTVTETWGCKMPVKQEE